MVQQAGGNERVDTCKQTDTMCNNVMARKTLTPGPMPERAAGGGGGAMTICLGAPASI